MDLAALIHSYIPQIPLETGFLEYAEPTIQDAVIRLRDQGTQGMLVVPILLFEADHARLDIPDTVSQVANENGMTLLAQSLIGFWRSGLAKGYLEVTARNSGAVRLYERLGFRKVKTVYKASDVAYV